MAQPSNVKMSLDHLGRVVDDIWYYAGDRSADMHWYTKRASLAAIYSATELFMTQDMSMDYVETERFLDNKLKQAAYADASARQVRNRITWMILFIDGLYCLLMNCVL